jgi:hypothetical protein
MNKYFAYVDETQEGRYRLSIVSIDETKLDSIRTSLRQVRLSGQSRIHMAKESDRRRKHILQTIMNLDGWKAFVIESAPRRRVSFETRQELFLLAAQHPFWLELDQVIVEDSNERDRDKRTFAWLNKYSNHGFAYRFEKPSQDPGLWVADIVGWSTAKGGTWKALLGGRLTLLTAP